MTRTFRSHDDLTAAIGSDLGTSEWLLVDQQRVAGFAEATGDHQWIHVDPARAADGPFGGTIAHGYLTLALVPALVATVVDYQGWAVKINYGSDKVRFPAPVPVGSRVRASVVLVGVEPTRAGTQVSTRVTVEIQDPQGQPAAKPGLVAEILTLLASPLSPAAGLPGAV